MPRGGWRPGTPCRGCPPSSRVLHSPVHSRCIINKGEVGRGRRHSIRRHSKSQRGSLEEVGLERTSPHTRVSIAPTLLPQDHRWCDIPREHQAEGCSPEAVQCGGGQGGERWPGQVSQGGVGGHSGSGAQVVPAFSSASSVHTLPVLEGQA